MDLDNFNPHAKNPNIRKFFTALGWADEIGSGIRNTRKYLPYYIENAKPVFIDGPLFKTIIPLMRYTMSDFAKEWHSWLELDEKWLPKLTESLKNIEIDGQLQKMNWEEQVSYLVPSWFEKSVQIKELKISVQNKNRPSSLEKLTKLANKKLQYLVGILFMLGSSLSIDELMSLFDYKHKGKFRQNYLNPLESNGFIKKTNPDKPTEPNQKYLITEEGKRFLTAKD
jgi:ATP-dependent DNA helicase RecG